MTTHVHVTLLDPADPRRWSNAFFNGCRAPGDAWDWVARTVAEAFDVLPDDVGCDESESGDLVTVNGEAVALINIEVRPDVTTATGRVVSAADSIALH